MISLSGIRGIFGDSLTPETALKYAAHYGIFCERKTVIVGRDSRTSGETIRNAVVAGLLSVGCKVIDIGIVSTPTLLLAVEESEAEGGICITASHNPAEWNALKLCGANGMFLFPEKAEKFLKTLNDTIVYAKWNELLKISYSHDATERHLKKILSVPYLDIQKIRQKSLKVVIDSVNGAGGTISPKLLRELGCQVIEINSEPDGMFPRNPEPLAKNLEQLCKTVLGNRADVGFATDPDVDRLSIVSEEGIAIGEEFSLLLAAEYVLSKNKGDLVTNLSTSMAIDDIAAKYGVKVHRTAVGEINVGKKMLELKSPVGGEGNGGIICPEVHYTRDAPAGMALILSLLAERELKVSELIGMMPKYYICKDKLSLEPEKLDKVMQRAGEFFAGSLAGKGEIWHDVQSIDRTDGIKIIGKNSWVHIRKSGTEPIIRVYVESNDQEHADSLCRQTVSALLNED